MTVSVDQTKTGIRTIQSVTWATKPSAASVPLGTQIRATDVGIAPGMLLVSDGVRWLPDGPQILARSAVTASITGTTTETALVTVPIPAGAMGLAGGLLIHSAWSYTNSANTKTPRVRLGGLAGTAFLSSGVTTTAGAGSLVRIRNRGTANSQVAGNNASNTGGGGTASFAPTTGAINTAVDQDLVLSGHLTNAGETIAVENYEVWLLP